MLDTRTLPLDQPIGALTVADLRALIASTIRQILREEMHIEAIPAPSREVAFFDTFGSWQDDRSAEDIAREILESRTVSTAEVAL